MITAKTGVFYILLVAALLLVQTTPVIALTPEHVLDEETGDYYIPLCYTEEDIIDIARVLYRECRGNKSKTEQACVVWVICNRADARNSTIHDVVRAPNQFAFNEDSPVWDNLYELAEDVLIRWDSEKRGGVCVGRVLPPEYQWFHGSRGHNWFKDSFRNYRVWDYSLASPYET